VTTPVVNTHVHVPPNFSAFASPEDVVETARAEGARAIGISNFYDQQVYGRFAELCRAAGIVPLFGLEFITLVPDLEAAGIRVNDPANPGRMYVCGKGIDPLREKTAAAAATAAEIREGNDSRAAAMVQRLDAHLQEAGLPTRLTSAAIAADVAARGGVPVAFVSLQERHIARAVEEAVSAMPADGRATVLAMAYGASAKASFDDPVAMQGEVRSRLLKAGTPGFAPEVPLSFESAYAYVLAMGGIPCYPTLADGVEPVCPFEEPASELAARLVERGIHLAELIPIRNRSSVVDAYVAAFRAVGIEVVAGTEHNTADRIPFDPACTDGPMSDVARAAFWRGTCIVAAHQARVAAGLPGYVDAQGALASDVEELVREGAVIIGGVEE
jgi:methylmalonyl-CoA mutase cobalamin-binding subunit